VDGEEREALVDGTPPGGMTGERSMRRTGFLYDERYLLHKTTQYHPEHHERLAAIYRGIAEAGLLEKLVLIKAKPADLKWVQRVHDPEYIKRFDNACCLGHTCFDSADNEMCVETMNVALLAVGGILEVLDRLMTGQIDNAFCAVRPPGHHAAPTQAMGFCYFNNIAIAAKYLQEKWGVGKVMIVDFDVHHGNGTQLIFEKDPTVFYYSIHEHPTFAYPGTGREFEQGTGPGLGFTMNCPVLPGQGDEEYFAQIRSRLFPVFDWFSPQVLLLSTGFDAHADDDMSDIKLSTDAFTWIAHKLKEMADRYCGGRLVSLLEGGYCIARLPELGRNHVSVLLED